MAEAIIWWLTIELLGLAALPLALVSLRALPDRGWAFAKILGLLVVGYGAWLLGMLGLPFGQPLNISMLLALVALSGWLLVRWGGALWRELRAYVAANAGYIIAAELLFGLAFACWAVLRAYDPAIYGTEKFMDFGFLNSLVRGGHLPPQDPWFIGQPINYYYFGYSLMATLCHLSGVDTAYGYNLANVGLFALTVLGAFGLVANLVAVAGRVRDNHVLRIKVGAIGAGLLGAVLVAVAGNLAAADQVITRGVTGDNFDWWAPSRVIRDIGAPVPETINEFPSFSFILGDLHPHVMALPLVLLALGFALTLLLSGLQATARLRAAGGGQSLKLVRSDALCLLCAALTVGALYAANTWDFPTYLLIMILALGLPLLGINRKHWDAAQKLVTPQEESPFRDYARYWLCGRVGRWLLGASGLVVLALLLFLPFHLTFKSQVGGQGIALPSALTDIPIMGAIVGKLADTVGINIWPKTWRGYIAIFGVFLYAIVGMLLPMLIAAWRNRNSLSLRVVLIVSLLAVVAGLLGSFPLLMLLVPLLAVSLYLLRLRLSEGSGSAAEIFVLALVAVGAAISLGAELFFLQDVFHGRMNTLFKFYYQVWVLWAVAAAFATWWIISYAIGALRRLGESSVIRKVGGLLAVPWTVGIAVLVMLSMVYVAWAPAARGGLNWLPLVQAAPRSIKGLDGTAYLANIAPDDTAAIRWLRANAPATAGIAEAPGPEYNVRGAHGRVSAYTGMPTIVAWTGHERQWRPGQPELYDQIATREADLELIYRTTDAAVAQEIMRRYGISYVFVGTIEKGEQGGTPEGGAYSRAALLKFATFMVPVFRSQPAAADPLDGTTVYLLR